MGTKLVSMTVEKNISKYTIRWHRCARMFLDVLEVCIFQSSIC